MLPQALAQGLPPDPGELIETLNTHCQVRCRGLPLVSHQLLTCLHRPAPLQCTRGAGGAASNYLAFGTSMDWMWQGTLPAPRSICR